MNGNPARFAGPEAEWLPTDQTLHVCSARKVFEPKVIRARRLSSRLSNECDIVHPFAGPPVGPPTWRTFIKSKSIKRSSARHSPVSAEQESGSTRPANNRSFAGLMQIIPLPGSRAPNCFAQLGEQLSLARAASHCLANLIIVDIMTGGPTSA